MSVLKWIWGLLKKIFGFLDYLVRFVVDIFSSVLSWIIVGLAWIVHLVFQYVGEFFYNLFAQAETVTVGDLPSNSLASWIARDLIALDVAWECFAIFFAAWVATRLARASFAAVRAVLDII